MLLAGLVAGVVAAPPILVVDRDNVEIRESCVVEIRAGVIEDEDGNGVIHVVADDVTIQFSGEFRELAGAPKGTSWDALTGIGIRIDGRRNVTIRGAHLHRFKVGIYANDADGLTLEDCDVAGGYMQRLRSTTKAEDGADWLYPHDNENNQWMNNHGAGIYVEESAGVTIRGCHARRRQNGIILDSVSDSKVYDNDCSFLSGWGLAMWRSSRNVITRNAFDFCVRGYSHGVYNRGQDSAGILMFEQNKNNTIAENSATHGGDCFFGFAGRDALGGVWLERERQRLRKETGRENVDDIIVFPKEVLDVARRNGNNDNLLINNDFSYAPAHGIEMTFSFGNRFIGNLLIGNAICGVWGGYSQDTLIAGNLFEDNGAMAYGLERGGVNIEHGRGNRILDNTFRNNKCGVHLWWDPDDGLMIQPWAKANHPGLEVDDAGGIPLTGRPAEGSRMLPSADNVIDGNTFEGDALALHLRDADQTQFSNNDLIGVGAEVQSDNSTVLIERGDEGPKWAIPEYEVYGETRPVGARSELAGRHHIIMTEWGPYDWVAPHLRRLPDRDGRHIYEVLGDQAPDAPTSDTEGVTVSRRVENGRHLITVQSGLDDHLIPYSLQVPVGAQILSAAGTITTSLWTVQVFPSPVDPREDAEAWRMKGPEHGVEFVTRDLDLPYGGGGPSQLAGIAETVVDAELPGNHFGTIATLKTWFYPGHWRINTNSDDGIRVWVNNELVIDDWTHHVPRRHSAEFEVEEYGRVEIRVEYFELDGFAVLALAIEPAGSE